MDRRIDDMLTRMMENMHNQDPLFTNNNRNQNRARTTNRNRNNNNNNSNGMRYFSRQLDITSDLISNYNNNILEYQRNIGIMIALLHYNNQLFNERFNTPLRVSNVRTEGPFFSYSNTTVPQTRQATQNAPQRQQQIDQVVRTFTYSQDIASSLNDNRCPISLQEYVEGDELCEIITCGHIFKKTNLLRWLQRTNTCPSCRAQLNIPLPNNSPIHNRNTTTQMFWTTDNTNNQLFNSDFWRNFVELYDNSGNSLNDISNNNFSWLFNDASGNTIEQDTNNEDSDVPSIAPVD